MTADMVEYVTNREWEMIQFAAEGLTMDEIGARMGISGRTVKQRLMYARDRLGARNTVHLVAIAFRNGWLSTATRNAHDTAELRRQFEHADETRRALAAQLAATLDDATFEEMT